MRKSTVILTKENLLVFIALLAAALMLARSAGADEMFCSNFGGVVDIHINADVVADVDCTVGPSGFVEGNIYADKSEVRIQGKVNGNIVQEGRGGVILEEGSNLNGDIEENGPGEVWVRVGDGNLVNGDIEEKGPGGVTVEVLANGLFNGNIEEKDAGSLTTSGNGTLNGSTKEEGPGECLNSIAEVNGTACE